MRKYIFIPSVHSVLHKLCWSCHLPLPDSHLQYTHLRTCSPFYLPSFVPDHIPIIYLQEPFSLFSTVLPVSRAHGPKPCLLSHYSMRKNVFHSIYFLIFFQLFGVKLLWPQVEQRIPGVPLFKNVFLLVPARPDEMSNLSINFLVYPLGLLQFAF